MDIEKLEENIRALVANIDKGAFIFDLLLAYEQPKSAITRLKKGDYNLSKDPDEIIWKKKLYYKTDADSDLHVLIDQVTGNPAIAKHHPRFFIVTDFETLLAVDTKTKDTLDISIQDLPKHFDFFLPWAGMEKSQYKSENPADIKAAERMARLYDMIMEDNEFSTPEEMHALNIFLSRLLFCFFAEDTGIFDEDQFTNAIASHTERDGSDLQAYLQKLFRVLNTQDRSGYPKFLQDFPYVNGGLFAVEFPVPKFTTKSKKIIIESGELDWKEINPDIFGSMIQAVVHRDQRSSMGMHYTSVVNIMKVIEPLFLNDLKEELEEAGDSEKRLKALLKRLYHLRIFDPACGSGNFLIIAFKELCKLEIEIFKRVHKGQLSFRFESQIRLAQFYGIELDDFAHETAKLSLWLAEHQMNLAFKEVFGSARPTLPLQDAGNVVCGNATRLDWSDVCPKDQNSECYILGNPPYLGGKKLSSSQSEDMVIAGLGKMKQLDYVCCWFVKASDYIRDTFVQYAFVTTSSICQGEQVHLLWSYVFNKRLEIGFAYRPFPWSNNAKGKAGVICTIVGVRNINHSKQKWVFSNFDRKQVTNISPYLVEGKSIFVVPSTIPLNGLPPMCMGSNPVDGTHLVVSKVEYDALVEIEPSAIRFLKRYMGGNDLVKGTERYCIWIEDNDIDIAMRSPFIKARLEECKCYRKGAGRDAKKVADQPHKFCYRTHKNSSAIMIPKTSSSSREYIPAGFTDGTTVINVDALAIYDADPYVFAVISSKMHKAWLATVTGRLGTGFRYSVKLVYNTFPFPLVSESQKNALEECVFKVMDERESHSEMTLAELYDPEKMPDGLYRAHHEMDLAVERCYRSRPFTSDEERLEYLFKLYEKMNEAEREGAS